MWLVIPKISRTSVSDVIVYTCVYRYTLSNNTDVDDLGVLSLAFV